MLYEANTGDIQMALTGESMISRELKVFREERFLKIRDLLHSADVRFANAGSCSITMRIHLPTALGPTCSVTRA